MGDEKSGSDVEVDNDSVFSAPDCTKAEMTNQVKSVPVGPMVVPVQVETPNWSNIDSSKTLPLGGTQIPLTNSLGKKVQLRPPALIYLNFTSIHPHSKSIHPDPNLVYPNSNSLFQFNAV